MGEDRGRELRGSDVRWSAGEIHLPQLLNEEANADEFSDWEQVSSRTAERFAPTFPTRPFSPSAFTSSSTFPKTSYPLPQHLRIRSMPQRLMPGNPSLLYQPLQTRIHGNHISPG